MNCPLLPPGWLIGLAAGLLFVRLAWEMAKPFFAPCGRPVDRARQGALNLMLGAFDASLLALVFALGRGWPSRRDQPRIASAFQIR